MEFELTLGKKVPKVNCQGLDSLSLKEKIPTRCCQGLDQDVKTYREEKGAGSCHGLDLDGSCHGLDLEFELT